MDVIDIQQLLFHKSLIQHRSLGYFNRLTVKFSLMENIRKYQD